MQIILGVAGAVAGGLLAGPGGAVKGAMLGFSIGSTVGAYIDQANTHYHTADMGRTSDLVVTTASYGTSIPQCWGHNKVPGIIIWGTNLVEHKTEQSQGGGGSGGPSVTTTVYSYTISFAMLVCKGNRNTTNVVKKIYANDVIMYDSSHTSDENRINPRFYPGTETQDADPLIIASAATDDVPAGTDAPAFRGYNYMVIENMELSDFGNALPNFSIEVETEDCFLSDVFLDIFTQVGIDESQVDISLVEDIQITGMTMSARIDAKSSVQPLLDAYNVDLIDVNGTIKAVPRGGDPVGTLTWDDLGAQIVDSGSPAVTDRLTTTRPDRINLPKKIDLGYLSTTNNLQSATQTAIRISAKNNNYESINLPLVLKDAEAKKVVERSLYIRWVESVGHSGSAVPRWALLTPSDVLLLQIDEEGTLQRVRVTEAETGTPGPIDLKFVNDDENVLIQTAPPSIPSGGYVYVPVSPTTFFAWSGKELRNNDSTNTGIYVVGSAYLIAGLWRGAVVLMSVDGGSTYSKLGNLTNKGGFGSVASTLSASYTPDADGFDIVNTLDVIINPGTGLETTSKAKVKAGDGEYILVTQLDQSVDNSSNYEVLGFAEADFTSSDHYTLQTFLREQRGTLATGHTSTDVFVKLDAGVSRFTVASSLAGQTVLIKCVSILQNPDDVVPQEVYIQPAQPYYADKATQDALVADVAAIVTSGSPTREVFTIASDGDTVLTLSYAPLTDTEFVYFNGVLLDYTVDYTIVSDTLTLVTYPTKTGDNVMITYFHI